MGMRTGANYSIRFISLPSAKAPLASVRRLPTSSLNRSLEQTRNSGELRTRPFFSFYRAGLRTIQFVREASVPIYQLLSTFLAPPAIPIGLIKGFFLIQVRKEETRGK